MARGRESKQVSTSASKEDASKSKYHFYALRAIGSKPDENECDYDVGKFCFILFVNISSF